MNIAGAKEVLEKNDGKPLTGSNSPRPTYGMAYKREIWMFATPIAWLCKIATFNIEHGQNSPNASEPRVTEEAAVPSEDGLNSDKEDKKAKKAEQEVADMAKGHTTEQVDDTGGATIPVVDAIPDEVVITYDKDHPKMDLGTMYPSMKEFRLALRQLATNEEFELGTEKTDKKRSQF
ncbi:hypothetical protein E2562_035936 [Oryza meyeriana var. granulata]|uniref:Uncharacterized protein n=1 Tax=Oryza meyeriana var. granulata TaxID=110450 RepID=A0A6G1DSI0_9ORYZ|nr:hypothetical protein E2562_035936 [Oryza meyeriana var. granulata]